MLRIGDFSKLSRITIKMLRHYDEIGLLKPDTVDDFTGYRYYQESQLLQAERIVLLKNMGFGLTAIAEILVNYTDAREMERFLMLQKQEMLAQSAEIQEKIRILDSTINWLRKDGTMMEYEVCLKIVPERYVASFRQIIPEYAAEGILWQNMRQELAPLQIQDANPSYPIVVYHDGEYKERDVDVEAQLAVQGKHEDTGRVTFKKVEAVQVASVTYKGGYEQISRVNENIARWIADNGYEYAGNSFNIYYVSPAQTKDSKEFVTEVCYPVKKK
ncbi:MAG: MerR family transcriptional regulator [Lachnospiraceae bacterium]|nr:MerR family transcriptional regulator [Lachnospiraceae bacterium]